MNDIKRLKEEQRDIHPGFDSYLNCMTRSLFSGLAAFCLGFSGSYFLQKAIQRKVIYTNQWNILLSTAVATVVAYKVTSARTQACQTAWMIAEDKLPLPQKEEEKRY